MTLISMQNGNLIHRMWWISKILLSGGDNKSSRDNPECSGLQDAGILHIDISSL